MLRKALAAILLVVLPVCARAQSASPDFRDYQSLLDQYVRQIAPKGGPVDTRFDYEQLFVDERIWNELRSDRLEALHAQLLRAKPSAMSPAERLAWGINTYNFLVIERITLNLLVPRHKFQRFKSVDQITMPPGGFFTGGAADIEGRNYSLDSFQRRFVFGDTTTMGSGPRAPLRDPRLLFVTNPGRIGEPPIARRAFRADSLDRQLDEAVRVTLALPRFVTVQGDPPLLLLSDWLGRNRADFGGLPGMFEFVEKRAPHAVRDAIRKAKLTHAGRYVPVNPLLNQVDHPKFVLPATAGRDSVSP